MHSQHRSGLAHAVPAVCITVVLAALDRLHCQAHGFLQVSALERDIELARSDGNQVRREVEKLAHERDVLNKLRTAAENATGRQQDLMKVSENTKKNLENEISGYRFETPLTCCVAVSLRCSIHAAKFSAGLAAAAMPGSVFAL